ALRVGPRAIFGVCIGRARGPLNASRCSRRRGVVRSRVTLCPPTNLGRPRTITGQVGRAGEGARKGMGAIRAFLGSRGGARLVYAPLGGVPSDFWGIVWAR